MKKKTKILLYQLPAILLLMIIPALGYLIIKVFSISPYAEQLSWGGLILLLVIMALYFRGKYLRYNATKHFY